MIYLIIKTLSSVRKVGSINLYPDTIFQRKSRRPKTSNKKKLKENQHMKDTLKETLKYK